MEKGKAFLKNQRQILWGCSVLLSKFEGNEDLPGVRVDFRTGRVSSRWSRIFIRAGLREMVERRDYRALGTLFPFLSSFMDRSTEHERSATMTSVCTWYSEIIGDVKRGAGQCEWSDEELKSLERRVKQSKSMLAETFLKHCESGLFKLRYHLPAHTVDNKPRFGTLSFLDTVSYDHFNVHIKQPFRKISSRMQASMMVTLNVIVRGYKGKLRYRKEWISEKLERKDNRMTKAGRNGLHLGWDGIKIPMDEMERATGASVWWSSSARFFS